jgi:phosphatidylinositol glycan class M
MGQYLNAPATLTHLIWTLNPMILNINTRGSSESLLVALVLASLVLVKRRSMGWAAMVWAFSVHWKVYPIIYAAPILMQLHKMDQGRFWTWHKIRFGLVSAGTFLVLSVSCWLM